MNSPRVVNIYSVDDGLPLFARPWCGNRFDPVENNGSDISLMVLAQGKNTGALLLSCASLVSGRVTHGGWLSLTCPGERQALHEGTRNPQAAAGSCRTRAAHCKPAQTTVAGFNLTGFFEERYLSVSKEILSWPPGDTTLCHTRENPR